MKGELKVLSFLNRALADELTAINQYMVHSEMCDNWGYDNLHKKIEKRAIFEMKHAEKLIARILFLEGIPEVSKLNAIHIGANVEDQLKNDHRAEQEAIKAYNEGVNICSECNDSGTREFLEDILKDEEDHIDWIETQLDQIAQIGIQGYLSEQLHGE